jgi:hypothetical protein
MRDIDVNMGKKGGYYREGIKKGKGLRCYYATACPNWTTLTMRCTPNQLCTRQWANGNKTRGDMRGGCF